MRYINILGLTLILTASASMEAWAYDIDLGPLGHACDTCGGGVVGGLPVIGHALNEAQAQAGGAALEQWINQSRNSAMPGAMPIPPQIRELLTGYASEDSMNRVRFKIGDNGFANVAHVLEQGGPIAAVTLNDLIIFRGPTEAGDPAIWAHELTHVDQYAAWGVHDFAVRYVRDYHTAEDPAYAKQAGYLPWAQQHAAQLSSTLMSPGSSIGGVPLQGQQPLGVFCYTPIAKFGPGVPAPIGMPCTVTLGPNQIVAGRIGP